MNNLPVTQQESKQIFEVEKYASSIQECVISNSEEYAQAGEYNKELTKRIKQLTKMRLDKTRPLLKLKQDWTEFFNIPLNKLTRVKRIVDIAMGNWQIQQETLEREEQERLQELADKEAERLEKQAKKLEAKGKLEKAEELRAEIYEVENLLPVVEKKVAKIQGMSIRKVPKFRVVNESDVPDTWEGEKLWTLDLVQIGKIVRKTNGEVNIPGIETYDDRTQTIRGNN